MMNDEERNIQWTKIFLLVIFGIVVFTLGALILTDLNTLIMLQNIHK